MFIVKLLEMKLKQIRLTKLLLEDAMRNHIKKIPNSNYGIVYNEQINTHHDQLRKVTETETRLNQQKEYYTQLYQDSVSN